MKYNLTVGKFIEVNAILL